jgi:hypothetical protein
LPWAREVRFRLGSNGTEEKLQAAGRRSSMALKFNGVDTICNGIINLTPFHIDVESNLNTQPIEKYN